MFSDSLLLWLDLSNIITQLFVSNISAGGSGISRIVKMTKDALCFSLLWRENRHSVASLWCVTQKKHLLKMWVEQRGDTQQHKYHNHLSYSEYCLIQPFHRTGNTTHSISFMSVGVSCFVHLIALDIF